MLIMKNSEGKILMERRPISGIWGGLWSLPDMEEPIDQVRTYCKNQFGLSIKNQKQLPIVNHGFTHFDLDITPVFCEARELELNLGEQPGRIWFDPGIDTQIGLPAAVTRIMAQLART